MSSDPKSPPEPKSTEPAAADPTVTTVLGDAASALFEQQVVLIFDTETGLLVTSNETAQLQLGLDPDSAMPRPLPRWFGSKVNCRTASGTRRRRVGR